MYYCLFEQSGTFKNEFNETDIVIDLFKEIKKAYNKEESIFDKITEKDTILAFFPCVRFEEQIQLHFRGTAFQLKKYSDEQKLEYDLKLHKELDVMYETITKLAIVCIRKNIPLIIENPYSMNHYLVKYWSIKAKVIDKNRMIRGDCYQKPTQFWFINCEPKHNMILEAYAWNDQKKNILHTKKRSRTKFDIKRICKQIYKRIYSINKGVNKI